MLQQTYLHSCVFNFLPGHTLCCFILLFVMFKDSCCVKHRQQNWQLVLQNYFVCSLVLVECTEHEMVFFKSEETCNASNFKPKTVEDSVQKRVPDVEKCAAFVLQLDKDTAK